MNLVHFVTFLGFGLLFFVNKSQHTNAWMLTFVDFMHIDYERLFEKYCPKETVSEVNPY